MRLLTGCIALLCCATPSLAELYVYAETQDGAQSYSFNQEIELIAQNAWDDRVLDYYWEFGDGNQMEGNPVQHQYSQPGYYLVEVIGVASDGESSDPFYLWLFLTETGPQTPLDAYIQSPPISEIVLQSGESLTLQAGSDQSDAEFFWHLAGTDLFYHGNPFTLNAPDGLEEFWGDLLLTAIHPDGSVMAYPTGIPVYFFGSNHPPNATVVEPDFELISDEQVFVMNPGQTQVFRGVAEDPDGPEPLGLVWYDLATDTYVDGSEWTYSADEPGYFTFSLYAVDGNELWDPFPFVFSIWVRGANQGPDIWIETPSQTIGTGEILTLEANGYDPEMDEITYSWSYGDGRTGNGDSVDVSFTQAGAYQVTLTGVDAMGGNSEEPYRIWVFVNDYSQTQPNEPPYPTLLDPPFGAMFSLNQVIDFQGFAFDPDPDDTVTYYWDFDDGTLFEGSHAPTHSYSETGTYWVAFFARDSKGFTSYYGAFSQIGIYEGTEPPNGRIIEPAVELDEYGERIFQVAPGSRISLRGGVEGVTDLSSYRAEWWADETFLGEGFELVDLEVPPPGFYYLYLQVWDGEGIQDPIPEELTVWVRDYNTPPNVSIDEPGWEMAVFTNELISLSASYWDEEDDPVTLQWTLSDGRTFSGERVDDIRFEARGLYWVQVVGVDSEGAQSETYERRYITVFDDFDPIIQEPPEIRRLLPPEERHIGPRNSQYQFSAEAEDFFGESIVAWYWDFGNGQTSESQRPDPIRYAKPGFYQVKAYAQDASGYWSPYPAYWEIGIYGDNIPPRGEITSPELLPFDDDYLARLHHVPLGTNMTFSGTAFDPDGNLPLTLNWWLDGPQSAPLGQNTTAGPVQFDLTGYYSVGLEVIDSKDEYDPIPDYRVIHVVDPALKPMAYIGYPDADLTVEPGEELWFYGFGEDPNELDMTLHWDFGPNAIPSSAEGMDVYPVRFDTETPPGEPITVTLIAKTAFSESDPVSIQISVKQYHDVDFEPNNQISQAANLEFGTYSQLALGGDDTLDYFAFEVKEENRNLKLQLKAEEGDQGFGVQLFRQVNTEWIAVELASDIVGKDSIILQDMPIGTYALEVTHASASKRMRDGISYGIGLSTEKPVLFLPFLVEDGNLSSQFGLINTQSMAVDVTLAGLDRHGKTVVTKNVSLKPGERLFKEGLTYFGEENSVQKAKHIRWLRVQAPERLIGFSNSQSLDGSQMMSAGAFKSLNPSIVIPHIAQQTQQWYTRAVVVNATEIAVDLDFVDQGTPTRVGKLNANEQSDFRFTDVFSGSLPGWGRFSLPTGEAALAGVEIFGRKDGVQQVAALEMSAEKRNNPNFTYVRNNLYFTHVAKDTANFWTGMTLVNTEDQEQTCQIKAYNDDGQVLASLNQRLDPQGKLLSTVANLFPETAGISWLEVEADRGISGFVLFGDHGNKRLAGFPASTYLTDELVFPYVNENQTSWTGIALLNISEMDVSAEAKGYSDQGELLHQVAFNMAPKTKRVATVTNLFAGQTLSEQLSYIVVKADKKAINGFELFGSLENGTLGATMAGLSAQTK